MVFPYEGIGSRRSEEIRPTTWTSKPYILYVLIESSENNGGKQDVLRLEIQFQLTSLPAWSRTCADLLCTKPKPEVNELRPILFGWIAFVAGVIFDLSRRLDIPKIWNFQPE